jgi:hypothetical protein
VRVRKKKLCESGRDYYPRSKTSIGASEAGGEADRKEIQRRVPEQGCRGYFSRHCTHYTAEKGKIYFEIILYFFLHYYGYPGVDMCAPPISPLPSFPRSPILKWYDRTWTSDERTNHFVFFVGRGDGNIFDKNIFSSIQRGLKIRHSTEI